MNYQQQNNLAKHESTKYDWNLHKVSSSAPPLPSRAYAPIHTRLYRLLSTIFLIFAFDDEGEFQNEIEPACTSTLIKKQQSDAATNASMMYWQYNATELADRSDWTQDCQKTEQHSANNSEADWETVLRHYSRSGWQLNTPSSRGQTVLAGPAQFPNNLLPFPQASLPTLGGEGGTSRQIQVLDQGQPAANVLVALYTRDEAKNVMIAMDQGFTDAAGQIQVFGGKVGDTVRAATIDAALSGSVVIDGDSDTLDLHLQRTSRRGLALQAGPATPYLNLIPGTDGRGISLRVVDALPGSLPLNGMFIPGEGGGLPQFAPMAYSPDENSYNSNQVRFSDVGLGTGRIQVNGLAGGQVVVLNSDYNLQQLGNNSDFTLYSEDGNFALHIPEGSVPADQGQFATILPTGHVPVPLPPGKQPVGSAYEVRLSGSIIQLDKDGLVRLHYRPQLMGSFTDITIHGWDPASKTWQSLDSTFNSVDSTYAVATARLGVYAHQGVPGQTKQYLPMIVKQ